MSFDNFVKVEEVEQEVETIPGEVVENEKEKKVNDLVTIEEDNSTISKLPDYEVLNPELDLETRIDISIRIANVLKKVVEKQGLVKRGLNKKDPKAPYVLIEGWQLIGNTFGLVSETKVIDEIRNSAGHLVGYKAVAKLWRNPVIEDGEIVDGDLVSYAHHSATKEGFQKDIASMMSMAQTRALGKAYRQKFGWIMKMAGYETTPAEEMPNYKGD